MESCTLIIAFIFGIELVINVVPSSAAGRLWATTSGRRAAPPAPLQEPQLDKTKGEHSFGTWSPQEQLITIQHLVIPNPGESDPAVTDGVYYITMWKFEAPI